MRFDLIECSDSILFSLTNFFFLHLRIRGKGSLIHLFILLLDLNVGAALFGNPWKMM